MNNKYLIRVWDKKTKQMVYPNKILPEGDIKYYVDNRYFSLGDVLCCTERFDIMRYIGTDRKNKDIWEKDIIKKDVHVEYTDANGTETFYLDATHIGVAYLTVSKGAVLRHLNVWICKDPYEEKKLKKEPTRETKLVLSRSLVLGNIYENAEILEERKESYYH